MHRAARTGRYPLDALAWIERASEAIGTIHAVNGAITAITQERARRSRARQVGWFGLALVLFSGSLGLSLASLTRVRRMVDEVFQQKELAEITMDSIGDAVITTDVAARVAYLNPLAEELTGWGPRRRPGGGRWPRCSASSTATTALPRRARSSAACARTVSWGLATTPCSCAATARRR